MNALRDDLAVAGRYAIARVQPIAMTAHHNIAP